MPPKLRSPLKQNQFYCVSCRGRVSAKAADMCVKVYKNKKVKGGVPALRAYCTKCGTNLTKFIKHKSKDAMQKKFGKC
mgnify:CR=1|jgi:hypothetical protein